jgi:hypothetical protein
MLWFRHLLMPTIKAFWASVQQKGLRAAAHTLFIDLIAVTAVELLRTPIKNTLVFPNPQRRQ